MVATAPWPGGRRDAGISMIEVLVTIVIIAFGLLGLAGLLSRLQVSEMESYQRAQALLLLGDMASRITTNGEAADAYVVAATSPLGAGMTCPTAVDTMANQDLGDWCAALQGAAEARGSSRIGALVGGRGCVESLGGGDYLVTVAWQGLVPLSAPSSGAACGKDLFDGVSGSACRNDLCRRVVTTVVRIPALG